MPNQPNGWYGTRRERNRELRTKGRTVPKTRRIWKVRPTAIDIPEFLRVRAVRGLTESEDAIWLGRTDAWLLERMDREAGGNPEMTECEYRRCPICHRPLLAEDAEARRLLTSTARTGAQKPCGTECFAAARDKRWR